MKLFVGWLYQQLFNIGNWLCAKSKMGEFVAGTLFTRVSEGGTVEIAVPTIGLRFRLVAQFGRRHPGGQKQIQDLVEDYKRTNNLTSL